MRKISKLCLVLLCSAIACIVPVRGAGVVINEIMYHPPSTNLNEQWFELFNTDASPVDLSGWKTTKGVEFTFPAGTIIPAAGYLVVAADLATFATKNPGVPNVVGGWNGSLGHSIEISNASGQAINAVDFFSDGDWAVRRLGPVEFGHQGWEWFAEHDGGGASLELMNPDLPNSYAHNWASNRDTSSTPGRANSVASTNVAPFISAVAHAPIIPKSSDSVTITARILDEQITGLTVNLNWRVDGTTSFIQSPMFDDGAHNDGSANDGIFTAVVPPHASGTIIEFFIHAVDAQGHSRIYPTFVPPVAPANVSRTANLLYQVDNGAYTGAQPIYRLIMREIERSELNDLGQSCATGSDSDAAMNATWITQDGVVSNGSTTQFRYLTDARNRGHGSRTSVPHNFHLNIPSDRAWKNQTGINLNSQYSFSQVLGSAVFRKVGLSAADSRAVQLRVNGIDLMSGTGNSFGSYAANEQYNNDFVKRSFPLDPHGNSYRGIRQEALCDPIFNNSVADLSWHGANWAIDTYTNAYFKQNNLVQNDWSDLIKLLAVLNETDGTTSATYVNDVEHVLNVEEWMKYMAANTLLDNTETCLANGVGDDYALYRGTNDTRFLVLPYDNDTLMGDGKSASSPADGIFQMNALPTVARFMKTQEFAPVYYQMLKTLSETAFSNEQMNPLIDQLLGSFVSPSAIQNMKSFNASRVAYVFSQIPLAFRVASALPVVNGYPHSTTSTTTLSGFANAIDTRQVLVNGVEANWIAWQGTWSSANVTLQSGVNTVLVQEMGTNNIEIARTTIDIWYEDGPITAAGGTISANTTWTAANGPYLASSSLTIAPGATLTIAPGTSVYLGTGANLTVANGGRLIAEGTAEAPIHFTRQPGASGAWGGIVINGAVGSPETRITYADVEFNGTTAIDSMGGTLFLDHINFRTTSYQYVSLDDSSFIVSNCFFPTPSGGFEPGHGNGGIKSGGHGIFSRNFFGQTQGYNDVIDFTGGQRPGQPIVHFINNVFSGASDDMLDLDGTDAWVEGNIFLHSHRNGSPDSSSAVSGGNFDFGGSLGVQTSQITIVNNIFYDCDQAGTGKEGNFFTFFNNTIVHQNHSAGLDTDGAVVNLADTGTAQGAGMYLEGNIIFDAEKLVRNLTTATVTFTNNLMSLPWSGPGGGNSTNDPMFKHVPQIPETQFTSWEEAQVLRDWLSILPGSPAKGRGPNGTDGGVSSLGVSISGEPSGSVSQNSAALTVGSVRTGSGIPISGWPNGSGYTDYKWRLDGGSWSVETSINTPITLTGLANGLHHVEVTGKRDSGLYQDDPLFGADALVSTSKTWIVDSALSVRINEILAKNTSALTNGTTTPDLVELYNPGAAPVDLSGMGLSSTSQNHYVFSFPAGTVLNAGQYLVLYADSDFGRAGLHLGFALGQNGDHLYLTASASSGGALIDSVEFGLQIADYSIGRMGDGTWALNEPTFGSANVEQATGDIRALRINEWLTDEQFSGTKDFVELYNPSVLPVALGSLYLTDSAGALNLSQIPPLSFISSKGWTTLTADGSPEQGANHLNFKLSPDVGIIILSASDLTEIDSIPYGPQRTDISEGRSPSGSDVLASFNQPTPGAGNPGASLSGSITNVTTTLTHLVEMTNSWRYNESGTDLGQTWHSVAYNDSAWSSGRALFDHGDPAGAVPLPIATSLTFKSPEQSTYYFRTHFNFSGPTSDLSLNVKHIIDDGLVLYLNGVELYRFNMPGGAVSYSTLASSPVGDGALSGPYRVSATGLVQGDNVLAAEVHQVNLTSSDIAMAVALDAVISQTNIVSNGSQSPTVVLNEVLASSGSTTNSQGVVSDWVELFNPTTNTFTLGDLSLTDDLLDARKWVFPSNATLAANGFLVINCNRSAPADSGNTGFALNQNGGALYLFDSPARGGALLDSVQYGTQVRDYSIGRIPNGGGQWTLNTPSLGVLNNAAGLASAVNLHINEWMANSSNGNDWFELFNSATQPVDLSGLFLSDKLDVRNKFQISPLSFVGTGADAFLKFDADSNPGAGVTHTNFKLSSKGDSIGLFRSDGSVISSVTFGAQALDVSQGYLPDGSAQLTAFSSTASPGESNYLPIPNVIINEVLTHTDPPLEDAIELYNPSSAAVNLAGWFISNSRDNFQKFQIPAGTVISAGGYKVFYQYQFDADTNSPLSFTFNSAHGDDAYLSAVNSNGNLTGYRAHEKFGAAAHGVSFGQAPTSIGLKFVPLSRTTFGSDNASTLEQFRTGTGLQNAPAKIGPVVINEIMYHPVTIGTTNATENPDEEFIELQNISGAAVPLFDSAAPTNTWKLNNAVSYTFPPNESIAAGEYILIVDFDPSGEPQLTQNFRTKYTVATGVRMFGPYTGRLNNSGDTVELLSPDKPQEPPHPDAGFVPYVQVDKVNYGSTAPWPAVAAGSSLQKSAGNLFGDDPANWFGAAPTAGRQNQASTGGTDSDHDGMPDAWEIANGLNPNDPSDAALDPDHDGLTNLQEYFAGTDPQSAASSLAIQAQIQPDGIHLGFSAVAGKHYTLQFKDSLGAADWQMLQDVAAQPQTGLVTLTDSLAQVTRFYRLVLAP